MTVELLAEHHLEFLGLKAAAQACLSLHLSKFHIVGSHMSRLICLLSYCYMDKTRIRVNMILSTRQVLAL